MCRRDDKAQEDHNGKVQNEPDDARDWAKPGRPGEGLHVTRWRGGGAGSMCTGKLTEDATSLSSRKDLTLRLRAYAHYSLQAQANRELKCF